MYTQLYEQIAVWRIALATEPPPEANPKSAEAKAATHVRYTARCEILEAYLATAPDSTERFILGEFLIEAFSGLIMTFARRYSGRGVSDRELKQIAMAGFAEALSRVDNVGSFASYAEIVVPGAIKKHFRDGTSRIHIERKFTDTRIPAVQRANYELKQKDPSHDPTVSELALATDMTETEVTETLDAIRARHVTSSDDLLASDTSDGPHLADCLGGEDPGYDFVDKWEAVRWAMPRVRPDQARIIGQYYLLGMSQAQIAAELGYSQVHVSRLLAQALDAVRTLIAA